MFRRALQLKAALPPRKTISKFSSPARISLASKDIKGLKETAKKDEKRWIEMHKDINGLKEVVKEHSEDLAGLKNDMQKLKNFQQDLLEKAAVLNLKELYKTKKTIQIHLRSRLGTQPPIEADAIHERNKIAHGLELAPCIYLVREDPTLELVFNALFGVPSTEAKALVEFDEIMNFRVNDILSLHARLWQLAAAKDFIGPYCDWLDGMRSLQNLRNTDPILASSVERLATKVRDRGNADIRAARRQKYDWATLISD